MAKFLHNIGKWSAEKLSHVVLYSLMALTAFVFLLFYFVGYDIPAVWDEKYNNPLFTDVVIVLMLLLILAALFLAVATKVLSLRKNHTDAVVNGIHGKRITWAVVGGTAVLMALTYIAFPANEIIVNGIAFSDGVWLRAANMFVISSLVLVFLAVVAIVVALLVNRRRVRKIIARTSK